MAFKRIPHLTGKYFIPYKTLNNAQVVGSTHSWKICKKHLKLDLFLQVFRAKNPENNWSLTTFTKKKRVKSWKSLKSIGTPMPNTPRKINIERENDGLEDGFPFPGMHSPVPC